MLFAIEINSHSPKPVIAQTAYAVSGDRKKAINAGCGDYITKPVQVKELLRKMKKSLNSPN